MILSGPTRRRLLLCFICFLCVFPLCHLNGWLRSSGAPPPGIYPAANCSDADGATLTVLLWHRPFGVPLSLEGDVCWDLYRVPRCRLVERRAFFSCADVVVFHSRELTTRSQKLPVGVPRPRGQRWAWMSLEAPVHNGNLRPFANVFNMTISYRRDADVTVPYGERLQNEHPTDAAAAAAAVPPNKTSLICWVVSNYNKYHKRSKVYEELNAAVAVKVYGRWTKTPLAADALLPTVSRCYFYLAFENSLSKDYITEKLWKNAYLGGAVPVVLGPSLSDYQAVAPPDSFIHVDQFPSAADLGKHLQSLAADEKRYKDFFNWKSKWEVKLHTDWRERLCKICTVYDRLPPQKVYADLQAWVHAHGL
ncbi:unnamed protein product [Ophioblennius macclurei]